MGLWVVVLAIVGWCLYRGKIHTKEGGKIYSNQKIAISGIGAGLSDVRSQILPLRLSLLKGFL
jgi:hypothetical protein